MQLIHSNLNRANNSHNNQIRQFNLILFNQYNEGKYLSQRLFLEVHLLRL